MPGAVTAQSRPAQACQPQSHHSRPMVPGPDVPTILKQMPGHSSTLKPRGSGHDDASPSSSGHSVAPRQPTPRSVMISCDCLLFGSRFWRRCAMCTQGAHTITGRRCLAVSRCRSVSSSALVARNIRQKSSIMRSGCSFTMSIIPCGRENWLIALVAKQTVKKRQDSPDRR